MHGGSAAVESRVSLRPVPASAGLARRFAVDALRGWGHLGLVDVAELLVSELVTNAVLHARSDLDLVLTDRGDRVRVEVRDASPDAPAAQPYTATSLTGRGLALVASCADHWGVQPLRAGKAVWFELAVEG